MPRAKGERIRQAQLVEGKKQEKEAKEAKKRWKKTSGKISDAMEHGAKVEPGPLRVDRRKGVHIHF